MVTKRTSSENSSVPPQIEDPAATDQELYGQGAGKEQVDEPEGQSPEESARADVDAVIEAGISAQLIDLREAVVDAMKASIAGAAAEGYAMSEDVSGMANIQGVGFSESTELSGGIPGEPALTLYVAEPTSAESVRSLVASSTGISAAEDAASVPVNVVVTGVIDALSHRMRMRPAPGGISTGHFRITAGTLGCFARGRSAPRSNRVLMLSNNHVLANSNNASVNDPILQPGAADGGRNPADRIAILERWVNINFSGAANYVDCATGWCWSNLVRYPDLMYLSSGRPVFFRVSSTPAPCQRNMAVGKTGRTTQLTRGTITDCNATIRVNYGNGRVALFADQIAIRGASGDFSAGRDSGSLIWTWDARRNPVGLLFAGGGGITFANKIGRVLTALDIVIRS